MRSGLPSANRLLISLALAEVARTFLAKGGQSDRPVWPPNTVLTSRRVKLLHTKTLHGSVVLHTSESF